MTCWNCGQAADKHIAEPGERHRCPPDPGPTQSNLNLMAEAVGGIKAVDSALAVVIGRMQREDRALVEREHLAKARGYLADAMYRTRLAAHDE